MLPYLVYFLLQSVSATTFYVDSNADISGYDCTLELNPCKTFEDALESMENFNSTNNVISFIQPYSSSLSKQTFELSKNVEISYPYTSPDSAVTVYTEVPLSTGDRASLYINATVHISFVNFNVELPSNPLLSAPVFKVTSSRSLTLTYLTIQSTDSTAMTTQSIIDATAGTLILEGVTFSSFTLFDAPLLSISTNSARFSMKPYYIPCSDGADEQSIPIPSVFKGITRHGGNGTVFCITLDSRTSFNMSYASFIGCTLFHNGSINGFGGVLYLDIKDSSASFNFNDLEWNRNSAASNGNNIYARLPSDPHRSSSFWTALVEDSSSGPEYIDSDFVLEYNTTSTRYAVNVYELYPHVFVGERYYHNVADEELGTYFYPYHNLSVIPENTTCVYILTTEMEGSSERYDPYQHEPFTIVSSSYTIPQTDLLIRSVGTSSSAKVGLRTVSGSSPLLTVKNNLTIVSVNFWLLRSAGSSGSYDYTVNNTLFSVTETGRLNLTEVSFAPWVWSSVDEDMKLRNYAIEQSGTATLILNSVQFSSITLTSKSLLHLSTSGTLEVTDASFDSIYRESGNGAVIEETVGSGSLSLHHMDFTSCSTEGNGGAIWLNVTGGTVNLGTEGPLSFRNCYVPGKSTEDRTVGGGAVYIAVNSGNLAIGTSAEIQEDPDDMCAGTTQYIVSFYNCKADNTNDYYGYGGAIFLNLQKATTNIKFGYLSFSGCSATNGSNLYAYTTQAEYTTSAYWPVVWESFYEYARQPEYSDSMYVIYTATGQTGEDMSIFNIERILTYSISCSATTQTTCTDNSCPSLTTMNTLLEGLKASAVPVYVIVSKYAAESDGIYPAASQTLTFSKQPVLMFFGSPSEVNNPSFFIKTIASSPLFIIGNTGSSAVSVEFRDVQFGVGDQTPTEEEEDVKSENLNSKIFKVNTGSTLTLSGITITGGEYLLEQHRCQLTEYAIDASDNGILRLTDGTVFSYFKLTSSAPLLSVSPGDCFVLDGCSFKHINRTSGNGSIIHQTISTGETFNIISASFEDCGCQDGNGGALWFTVEGGTLNIGPALGDDSGDITFSECYVNSTSSLVQGGAIWVTITSGSFSLGSIPISSPAETAGTGTVEFTDCYAKGDGDGGALFLDITGGSVYLGVESDVEFDSCYALKNESRKARQPEQIGGCGGAMCVYLTNGSLQLGGIEQDHYSPDIYESGTSCGPKCDYSTGSGSLSFTDCYTSYANGFANSGGFGGAYYLRLVNQSNSVITTNLTFGDQSFERSDELNITGQGTFVYFSTNVANYIPTADRFSDLLLNAPSDYYKLDYFIAYDEKTLTRYQMYSIGNSSLYLESSSENQWYCGVITGCPTIESALLNMNRFLNTPSYIAVYESFVMSSSETLTVPALIKSSETFRSEIRLESSSSTLSILSNITFQNIEFYFTSSYLSNDPFTVIGHLVLNNVVLRTSSTQLSCSLINSSEGYLTLNNTQILTFTPLYEPLLEVSPLPGHLTLMNSNVIAVNKSSDSSEPYITSYLINSDYSLVIQDTSFVPIAQGYYTPQVISASVRAGRFTVRRCSFANARPTDISGGAISLNISDGSASIADCRFTNCHTQESSGYSGGAILLNITGGDVSISHCTFVECYSYTGGALSVQLANGSFSLSASTFTDCYAEKNGGGVYLFMSSGSLSLTDGISFTRCVSYRVSATAHTNADKTGADKEIEKGGYGGGMFIELFDTQPSDNSTDDFSFDFDRMYATNCSADQAGDALFVATNNRDLIEDNKWGKLVPKSADATSTAFVFTVANLTYADQLAIVTEDLTEEAHSSSSSTPTIIGVTLGVVIVIIIVVAVLLCCGCCVCCKRSDSDSDSSSSSSAATGTSVWGQESSTVTEPPPQEQKASEEYPGESEMQQMQAQDNTQAAYNQDPNTQPYVDQQQSTPEDQNEQSFPSSSDDAYTHDDTNQYPSAPTEEY